MSVTQFLYLTMATRKRQAHNIIQKLAGVREPIWLVEASKIFLIVAGKITMYFMLDIMGLAHLFNNSIKLYGPYMCINGFIPYGNLIERRLYLNTWSLVDLFEK